MASLRKKRLPDDLDLYLNAGNPRLKLIELPGEDDLPFDDGENMESDRHVSQMNILVETLRLHWDNRQDFYIGRNMFVYFKDEQVEGAYFRGPDVFVVQGVPRRERKSWVVWKEDGRVPDVIIELLSTKTRVEDRTVKKDVYQNKMRVPEYFWFDPYEDDFAGFKLDDGVYVPIALDGKGRMFSSQVNLFLRPWNGEYDGIEARWLRWETAKGKLLPTKSEVMERERKAAKREREIANRERERAKRLEALLKSKGINPDA